jgi:pyruvate dehydrogenase (quinone)
VIVFEGDGAMQMNGLAELITIKHYWREWADPRSSRPATLPRR